MVKIEKPLENNAFKTPLMYTGFESITKFYLEKLIFLIYGIFGLKRGKKILFHSGPPRTEKNKNWLKVS